MQIDQSTPYGIVAAIETGQLDEYLHKINHACKERHDKIRAEKAETLRAAVTIGSRVKLTGIKPRYMEGAWATVKKINQTRAVVNLDHERGKWRGDITVPLSCLSCLDYPKETVS